jgi:branched-chain amino acid transport system permease protein
MHRTVLLLLIVAAGFGAAPFAGMPSSYESFLYLVFYWIALSTSWNILSGYSGYFSFGHGAFFGIGMYTTAVLTTRFDISFLWSLPAAAAVAAAFALVLGAVALRVASVRGELFALITLAATFIAATIIVNTPIDGGGGVYLSAVPVPVIAPTPSGSFYLMALGVALIAILASVAVFHSRFGAGLFAIRDDEDVAEVMGVPTYRYKLIALAISSVIAGLMGGIHALFVSYLTTADTFGITLPLTVVLMAVLGGSRHWAGPVIGAVVISCLLYGFSSGDSALIGKIVMGIVLICVILFMPQGIVGNRLKRRLSFRPEGSVPNRVAALKDSIEIGEVLLSAAGVGKSFNGFHALRGVDVDVRCGEILGLLGPNGSGKSTFINVISGHYIATSGKIKFDGKHIAHLKAHRVAGSGVARTYQIPRPFDSMTVLENVALSAMFGREKLGRKEAEQQAWEWLDFTDLAEQANALPDELNLHQRKFLEFARALAARPKLLMLDEVLSGLTPSEIDNAVRFIQRIRANGTTIIFVEHVMRAVNALCDRIVIFNHGQVLAEGPPADVFARQEVKVAYLGKVAEALPQEPVMIKENRCA